MGSHGRVLSQQNRPTRWRVEQFRPALTAAARVPSASATATRGSGFATTCAPYSPRERTSCDGCTTARVSCSTHRGAPWPAHLGSACQQRM